MSRSRNRYGDRRAAGFVRNDGYRHYDADYVLVSARKRIRSAYGTVECCDFCRRHFRNFNKYAGNARFHKSIARRLSDVPAGKRRARARCKRHLFVYGRHIFNAVPYFVFHADREFHRNVQCARILYARAFRSFDDDRGIHRQRAQRYDTRRCGHPAQLRRT